ncbi:hypothetical protein BCF44_103591 [Kutzneria buriramensis]|uniref:Uncharacterized protein n=1 Tax=Kutzneria buriramensis TaxID=1045776 RepID=A0A3E0I0S1_9PSEU|nr:hypothetical protein BCF44_103591 [Kutzneria buriramensis]
MSRELLFAPFGFRLDDYGRLDVPAGAQGMAVD